MLSLIVKPPILWRIPNVAHKWSYNNILPLLSASKVSLINYTATCDIFSSNRRPSLRRHIFKKGTVKDKFTKWQATEQKLRLRGELILEELKESKQKMKKRMEAIIERENIWTVPNMLCVMRVAMTPHIGFLIMNSEFETALYFMVVAGVTDLFDGWIARTFPGQSSKLGTFLDPLADKILISTLVVTLSIVGVLPILLSSIIIMRDVALASAACYIRYQSLPPPKTLSRYLDMTHATVKLAPTFISKVNTMVQLFTCSISTVAPAFHFTDHPYLMYLWLFTGGTTIASALSYVISKNTYKFLKKKGVHRV